MSSNSQIRLNYLVFDDEDDEKNQNGMKVKIPGLAFNLIFINPNDSYIAENETFNIEGFEQEIIDKTKGQHISLIATDWNMVSESKNYPQVNGFQIIEILIKIKEKFKKCPYLIYSANPLDASRTLISKIRKEVCNEISEPINSLEILSMLLELKIIFCSRPTRFAEITKLLKSEKTISSIVLSLLTSFEEGLIINTGNENYDGRKIEVLIDMISKEDDFGLKFIREFIELSIANYTEINE